MNQFENPDELLEYLRDNTTSYPAIDLPEESIPLLILLSEYRHKYTSPIMEAIYSFNLMCPVPRFLLMEMIGRFSVFYARMECFDSFDVDSIVSIRKEVKKRKPLYKNLKKLTQGKLDYVTLKALLSGLTRMAIEHEQRVGDIEKVERDLSMILEIVYSGLRIGLSDTDVQMLRFIFLGEE